MKPIWTIAKRELHSYFNSPLAYIFIDVFLVVTAWLFFQSYFLIGQATMRVYFAYVPWVFLFLIPAITMRLWAEEKKMGTVELLLTLPVRDETVVIGKFLASFLFLAITLALSFAVPAVVSYTGPADLGVIFSSYIAALFLGGSYIALGIWISAFTDNQIIAFILSIVAAFTFYIIGETFVLQRLPGFVGSIFHFLGIGSHYGSLTRGVLDSRDLLYYFSFIGFFLFLNVRQISSRRFR